MPRRHSFTAVVVLGFVHAGCDTEQRTNPLSDAGPTQPDAGNEIDAGPQEDAGSDDAGLPDASVMNSCADGIKNGDESSIDCGGSCPPCKPPLDIPFLAGLSSYVGPPLPNGWELLDLDGDGKLDAVTDLGGFYSNVGFGNGIFDKPSASIPDTGPFDIFGHADFDGDLKDDVLSCFGNNGLRVFRGSDVSPTNILDEPAPKYQFKSGNYVRVCATADFNADGKPDVVVGTSAGTVEIGLNNDGFVAGNVYTGFGDVRGLAAFDVDGVNGRDILAFNLVPAQVRTLLANGDGTFTQGAPQPLPAGTTRIRPYRDGTAFLAILAGTGELSVAPIDASGVVGVPVPLGANQYESVAEGDIDGDGTSELVAPHLNWGFVDVHKRVNGNWMIVQTYRPNWKPQHIRLADVNADGALDMLMLQGNPVTIDVLLNQGNGVFAAPIPIALDARPDSGGAFADLNGDGLKDILIPVDSIPNQFHIDSYLSQPGGGFVKATRTNVSYESRGCFPFDFNADGKMDFAVRTGTSRIAQFQGDGLGGFVAGDSFYGISDVSGVHFADIDANGKAELLMSGAGSFAAYDANATFFDSTPHVLSTPAWPALAGVPDVDGDGQSDLLVMAPGGQLGWSRSQGGYVFDTPLTIGAPNPYYSILPLKLGAFPRRWLVVVSDGLHDWLQTTETDIQDTFIGGPRSYGFLHVDWNHDGIKDLIGSGETIVLYKGNADGSFAFTGKTLLGGGRAVAMDFFDATGDGLEDLVVVNYYGGISVLAGLP